MPTQPHAAKAAARLRMAQTGEKYTAALRHVTADHIGRDDGEGPGGARDYLAAVLSALRNLGWPCQADPALVRGAYVAHCGPAAGLRIAVSRRGAGSEDDPDDPRAVDLSAPLRLGAVCPAGEELMAGDLDWRADAGRPPKSLAGQLDHALTRTRLARVRGMDAESTEPCPLCGDRYPADHLLPNSPGADAVCPACIFDGDQQESTSLPYLASKIDELTRSDLSAPAGWDAVAAILALCCGRNLGARADRELGEIGFYPVLAARWRDPMLRSWIWLPPRRQRHAAFAHLGAGATVAALVDALDRYKPDIRVAAKSVCRDDGVRWRDGVWSSAVAYAVAFSTQAFERHRHRKPVHVVASTSNGLSLIDAPFQVSGDPLNVEGGLHALLEYLLFPLLLGHGLHDEPREPARQYGVRSGDPRPPRRSTDARVMYGIDRSVQLASILGMVPGYKSATRIWDGPAGSADEADPLGPAAPSSELVAELRQEMRLPLAGYLYDTEGSLHATALDAWKRLGWWVPADEASQALRQAWEYVDGVASAQILWAGPDFPEALWLHGTVTGVTAHCSGPRDAPAIDVQLENDVSDVPGLRAGRPITLLLSDIVTVGLPLADTSWLGEEGHSFPAGPQGASKPGRNQPATDRPAPGPGDARSQPGPAGSKLADLRTEGRKHLQTVARNCGEHYDATWAWNSFGLWIPPEDPTAAYDEMLAIFGKCSPEHPATVEILWQQNWDDSAPAWYRIHIMETYSISARPVMPVMRGFWANPKTSLIVLEDVVAVRPSIEGLPLSCTGTASPEFRPSPLRAGSVSPDDVVPEIMMTQAEAELMISLYLHFESHRLGPLWTTIDEQAAATRDRLMEIVTAAAASGPLTEVNVTVAVRDTTVSQCQSEVFDPAPAYTSVGETRTVGLHEVAHAHWDGTVGLEEHGREHLDAVLTCMALYGGSLHLATVPFEAGALPTATQCLYLVHYDWRCELVEGVAGAATPEP